MKIAYLANVRFPSERAHATHIAHMCQAFVSSGASLDLFVNKRTLKGINEVNNFFGISANFSLVRISSGIFVNGIRLFFYINELIFSLNFLPYRKEYDFFYSRNEWTLFFLSFLVGEKKLIWESHEAKLNLPARYLIKNNIKIVVISEGIHAKYLDHGLKPDLMLIAHDCIDESFFGVVENKEVARKRLDIPLDSKVVMYIGGFDKWKGIETFCEAAEEYKNVKFVAIGGRDEQIRELKSKYKSVTFLEARPYLELKDNQQAADILVIPNSNKELISSEYTSPLKLFAHMASGIPIVASNIPSLRTMLNNTNSTFFEPDNSKSLYSSLIGVFDSYEDKLVKAQQLKISSRKYTWTERAKAIKSFIS